MESEQKKPRISNVSAFLLVGTAVVFDIFDLLVALFSVGSFGWVVSVANWVVFMILFSILHVPLIGTKQLTRWGLSLLGDVASAGILPGTTVGVILMIVLTRTEDKTGVSIINKLPVGKNLSIKEARRVANPEKALEARMRLQRRLERQTQNSAPTTPSIKERTQMRDITYPKAS